MKRLIVIITIALLLVGCGTKKQIDESIKDALAMPLPISHNHSKPYMNYYLPPSVGLKKSNEFSSLFLVRGYDVLMNLNIEYAISETFEYDLNHSNIDTDAFDFTYAGTYINANNSNRNFRVLSKDLNSNKRALFIDNNDVQFVTVVDQSEMSYMIATLITIMRSVEVDVPKVVAQYSNKDIKKTITFYSEFFERVPPESGTLEEMYEQLTP